MFIVSATWSARHLLPLLDFKTALLGFRSLVAAVFSAYMSQEAPALSRSPDEFVKGEVDQEAWDKLIKELFKFNYEMHVYKVLF